MSDLRDGNTTVEGSSQSERLSAAAARRDRLTTLMRAMAHGQHAAIFLLATEFGPQIGATMRRHLRRIGLEGVDAAELDGLVIDACIELSRVASGWDPDGGALPWTWAERRLRALAAAYVGIHADALDTERHEHLAATAEAGTGDPSDPDVLEVLDQLASRRPECALVSEALGRVANARNRGIVLDVRVQSALGDPSPATTVGRDVGLQPEAVRQVVHRTRRALRHLVDQEPRFAPVAATMLVA